MNYKQHTLECVFCQYKSQLLSPRWPTPAGLRTTLAPAVFWSHISCFTAQSAAAALKRMSPEITKEDWMNRKKKQDKAKHYNKFQSWFHLINHIRNIFMVNNINSMISASLIISHIYFMLHLDKVNKSEKLRIVLFGFKAQLTKNIL